MVKATRLAHTLTQLIGLLNDVLPSYLRAFSEGYDEELDGSTDTLLQRTLLQRRTRITFLMSQCAGTKTADVFDRCVANAINDFFCTQHVGIDFSGSDTSTELDSKLQNFLSSAIHAAVINQSDDG